MPQRPDPRPRTLRSQYVIHFAPSRATRSQSIGSTTISERTRRAHAGSESIDKSVRAGSLYISRAARSCASGVPTHSMNARASSSRRDPRTTAIAS